MTKHEKQIYGFLPGTSNVSWITENTAHGGSVKSEGVDARCVLLIFRVVPSLCPDIVAFVELLFQVFFWSVV